MTTTSLISAQAIAHLIQQGDPAAFRHLGRVIFEDVVTGTSDPSGNRLIRTLQATRDNDSLDRAASRLSIKYSGLVERFEAIHERTGLDPRRTLDRFLLDLGLYALEVGATLPRNSSEH